MRRQQRSASGHMEEKKVTIPSKQQPNQKKIVQHRKKRNYNINLRRRSELNRFSPDEWKCGEKFTKFQKKCMSEMEKMDNVRALKKEISEWKRQEELRSKVNQVLRKGGAESDKYGADGDKHTEYAESPKSILVKHQEDRKVRTPETTDQDVESARYLKVNRKKEKKRIPAVTWIPMQPEVSTQTSLKSFADYLSETTQDIPTPKRRLCLSPETLDVLENAEKLLVDAEEQISQLNLCGSIIDDLELDKFDDRRKDKNIYIRNIVASTFEKGFYDPKINNKLNKENIRSKFTLAESTKFKTVNPPYKSPRNMRESLKPIHKILASTLEDVRLKPTIEDCLVCKASELKPTKDKITELLSAKKDNDEKKIDEGKPEKLNVQKGPVVSIKGDFSIQTKKIIDIQPDEHSRAISKECIDNIATFEFRHGSCESEKSTGRKDYESSPATEEVEKSVARDATFVCEKPSGTIFKPDKIRSRRHERRRVNKTALDKRNKSLTLAESSIDDNYVIKAKEQASEKRIDFWKAYEEVEMDLDNFILKEPRILTEMDMLLEHQTKIIRQVHNTTEKFDKFLAKRISSDVSSTLEKNDKKLEHYFSMERKIKKNNAIVEKKSEKLISNHRTSESSTEKKSQTFSEHRLTESLSEIGNIVNKSKEYDITYNRSSSMSCKSDKLEISADSKNAQSSENSLTASKSSKKSSKVSEKKDSVQSDNELVAEISKDAEYTGSFEKASSVNETLNESERSSLQISRAKSSNHGSLVQTSAHTDTRSNSGFIENLKSVQVFKENNLDANPQEKNKESISEILESAERTRMEKVEEVNTNISDNGVAKDSFGKSLKEVIKSEIESNAIDKRESKNNEFENRSTKETLQYRTKENLENQNEEEEENRKDRSTEKMQDNLDQNSQKTFHLIESISEISFHTTVENTSENTKDSQNSLRLSSILNDKTDNTSKPDETVVAESSNEKSTESKIESKLSEARDNLNTLMKTMNGEAENFHHASTELNSQASDNSRKSINKNTTTSEKPISLKNELVHKDILDQDTRKNEIFIPDNIILNNIIPANQEYDLSNTRSFVAMLQENSNEVLESFEHHKLSLLKKLDSCSIPSNYQGKRFFTSTVLGDMEPPNSFGKLKESSESSSDTHSEGEVILGSSASYSLGEVRKIVELSKSNSNARVSSSDSTNPTNSLPHSIGEVCGS